MGHFTTSETSHFEIFIVKSFMSSELDILYLFKCFPLTSALLPSENVRLTYMYHILTDCTCFHLMRG